MKEQDKGELDAVLDRIVHDLGRPIDDLERQIARYGCRLIDAKPAPRAIGFRTDAQRVREHGR